MDNLLSQTTNQLLGTVFLAVFTLATMAFITPWLTVVILFVCTLAVTHCIRGRARQGAAH